MHTIEIPDIDKVFYIPSELSECDSEQYINMCNLLYKEAKGKISFETLKTHAVYYLLGLHQGNPLEFEQELKQLGNLGKLEDLIDTFFEDVLNDKDEVVGHSIKQYYIHNPIGNVQAGFPPKVYAGPSDEFNHVQFGEYIDALGYFADYNDTKDEKYLYLLMATMYRERLPWYHRFFKPHLVDLRCDYDKQKTELIAKKLAQVDKGIVYGFYLLFASFQKYLPTAKIFVQGVQIDFAILYDNSKFKDIVECSEPSLGMESTQYMLAESGVFGDLDKLRSTYMWEIFKRLYDIRKRDLDALAQQKKQQSDAENK